MRIFAIYYFLFMSLIVGGFASMAQNDYGFKIIGYSAIGFALLFFIQSLNKIGSTKPHKWLSFIEYLLLSMVAIVFACRALFIHFQYIEIIFSGSCIVLVLLHLDRLIRAYQSTKNDSAILGYLVGAYNLSIILFLLSLSLAPFSPLIAEVIGVLSFGVLLIFIGGSISKKNILLEGEKISPIKFVLAFKNTSVLMITVLLIFSGYIGLTKIDVIPRLYSSEYPQGYIELIEQAESGKETQVNGQFKHEIFKKRYDAFVEKNLQ